jgi:hypothetical protein
VTNSVNIWEESVIELAPALKEGESTLERKHKEMV